MSATNFSSIAEVHNLLLVQKSISCVQVVQYYLNNITAHNASINAFLEVFDAEALQAAQHIDAKIANNETLGSLAGVVVAIKDNIVYKNHKSSASSKILDNYTSIYSATVVERMLAEDAIIIGRVNCDEFAMGGSNENSAMGVVRNPLDVKRVPGGSSGGSAAAVAANMCLIALGTDTGGSIRQPAAFCGIVGLKPTYGRVSRYGAIAYASSFDQIGPLANNVDDCARILQVIAGTDAYDATLSNKELENYTKNITISQPKNIAVLRTSMEHPALDAEVKQAIELKLNELKNAGHTINYVDFPNIDYLVPTYYVLTTAEASSNLSRYDGVHFGYRSPNATNLETTYIKSRSEGFGAEVKRRIMLGTFVLSAGYYDAYYGKAQRVRRVIKNEIDAILATNDFILMPTAPSTAFEFGAKKDPIAMYLEDIYTVLANLVGLPAISVPCGTHSNGMPIGMQIMAKAFNEAPLLAMAHQLYSINKS
jgi:aspartyl-tRNA(Asn)/glutamyl-tRNA(Gln) amidotransferase subunit A